MTSQTWHDTYSGGDIVGLLGSTIKGGVKSGIRVFGRSRAVEKAEPSELEKVAKDAVHQLAENNTKLMQHVEHLMTQHGETVKLLLDTIKKMNGLG